MSLKGVLVKGAKISGLLSFIDIGSFGPFEYTPLLVASKNRKSKNAECTANCTRTVFKLDICIRMLMMSTLATIWSVLCTYIYMDFIFGQVLRVDAVIIALPCDNASISSAVYLHTFEFWCFGSSHFACLFSVGVFTVSVREGFVKKKSETKLIPDVPPPPPKKV